MRTILLLLMFNIHCFSQNIMLEDNEGLRIIFSANEDFQINTFKAYDINRKEIIKLEKDLQKLINQKIPDFKQSNSDKVDSKDWASMDMKNYIRQYSGFINSNDEEIIFINFLSKEDLENTEIDFKNNWVFQLPCCKSYMMTYNTRKRTFSDLSFMKL